MFRAAPAAVPVAADVVAPVVDVQVDLIPITHLALDLPEPTTGWLAELGRRGIQVVLDDIGRKAISRADARMLLDERRENEARQRERREAAEVRAVEADRRWRRQLWGGM